MRVILIIKSGLGMLTVIRGRKARAILAWALSAALLLVACGDGSDSVVDGVDVVATTTMLGDVARNIVGENGSVTVLLPIGADPHSYQPSSQQAADINRADLVIANGLGLEEGLSDVLEAASADGANVLELGPLLDPLPFTAGVADDGHNDDSHDADPHFWHDPIRMVDAAEFIRNELSAIDASVDWGAPASAYIAQIVDAHEQVEYILDAISSDAKRLVTNHASLGYFADRYAFDLVGVVVPGGSTLADPSSAELAGLADVIEQSAVLAIFAETTEPRALAEAVADEVGFEVSVVELYTGSLGETGSGAETLVEMWLTNARRVAAALS